MPAVAHPSQLLRQILHECGLSQSAFARAVGVTPLRVSHVTNGTRSITAELRPAVRQGARPAAGILVELAGRPRSGAPRKERSAARSALNGSPDVHGDRGPARPQALGPLCPGDRAGAGLAVRSGSLKKGDDDA